jgi:ABC-type Mn2+/Zn2+ transport system permease subunit
MFELLSYTFLQRAFIVGSLIAISSSFLGIFLVLRKYSMIGDGLAHVSFGTVALALLLNQSPLIVSIPIVILASFLILKLSEENKIGGDAAIALVSSTAIALGVFISSLASGFNVDLFSYLFGSILIISALDVWLSLVLSIVVIVLVLYYFHDLFSVTYNIDYAKVSGINTTRMNQLIAILTSITIVLGIRVVGTMLISSFIIFPTVIALKLGTSFSKTIALSVAISLFCVIMGIITSVLFDFPTVATIVLLNATLFILASLYSMITKKG